MTEYTMEIKFLLWKSFNQIGQGKEGIRGLVKIYQREQKTILKLSLLNQMSQKDTTQKTIQVIMRHLIKELVIFLVEEEQNLT